MSAYTPEATGLMLQPEMPICQTDYPQDWYQTDFVPYAKSYLALPDRKFSTVIDWMRPYMQKAKAHFGDSLLLLAHYYMGGEIVKLIEYFGGYVGDSYQLSVIAQKRPEKTLIVESAVHFMAEAISLLAHPHQNIYITNPKAGCTMEMHAKDFMVAPAFSALNRRYGQDHILPICYMNTSGRLKSMTGKQGGAVCTSSNVTQIFRWALSQDKKILFIPDQHMGENVAAWCGILPEEIAYWPGGTKGAQYLLEAQDKATLQRFDRAKLIVFCSECQVHTYYDTEMVAHWQSQGFCVVVHPECRHQVVQQADATGSTAFIWDFVKNDRAKTKKYAIGTENHMVDNLKVASAASGIAVVNLADASNDSTQMGCGCATMARNDPPHLVALLDLLRCGKTLHYNRVHPGDTVNPWTGSKEELEAQKQADIVQYARVALQNMIAITEQASR